jgi:uncharacterized protein YlxP (DUF503 family)
MEVRIPTASSLKDKRTAIRPLLEGARSRYRVAASEVGFQDHHQRARLGFAAIGSSADQVREVLDKVERFVWSHAEIVVLVAERTWLEDT